VRFWPPPSSAGAHADADADTARGLDRPRLSELLHEPVFDAELRPVGRVHDVRLVQDGPLQGGPGGDAAFRVDGLVVGKSGLGVRLGFHRANVQGPLPLKLLFTWLEQRAHYVKWDQVEAWDDSGIRLSASVDDLHPMPTVD
jgi:hypothetical protein